MRSAEYAASISYVVNGEYMLSDTWGWSVRARPGGAWGFPNRDIPGACARPGGADWESPPWPPLPDTATN